LPCGRLRVTSFGHTVEYAGVADLVHARPDLADAAHRAVHTSAAPQPPRNPPRAPDDGHAAPPLFVDRHVHDETDRDVVLRSLALGTLRTGAHQLVAVMLPAFLSALAPQFALLAGGTGGVLRLQAAYHTYAALRVQLPFDAQPSIDRRVFALQSQHAIALGGDGDEARWNGLRPAGDAERPLGFTFVGTPLAIAPHPLLPGLTLGEFAISARGAEPASIVRVVAAHIDPATRTIRGAHSTVAVPARGPGLSLEHRDELELLERASVARVAAERERRRREARTRERELRR
jgi:hypothetical protein